MSSVVVIGAGLAGLSAACYLTGQGHEVTVVEREPIPGGRAGRLNRDGFAFDTGPTVLTMPDLIAEPLRAVGSELSDLLPLKRLDPAYGDKDIFRVDVFWFGYNGGDPVQDFYPQFWKALEGLEYRLHWGKFLPTPEQMPPAKLTARFPKFEAWKAARAKADPNGVFLTKYWKDHLGL